MSVSGRADAGREVPLARLAGLYVQGSTLREVAAKTGLSKSVVHARLVEAGVQMRSGGRGRRRVDPAEVERVRKLYEDGATPREIQAVTGRSRSAVQRLLTASGVQRRPRGGQRVPLPVPVEGLAELYAQGLSLREVAEATGVSYEVTRRRLLEAGVKLRGPCGQPAPDSAQVARLRDLYEGGASLSEIHELTGVSVGAIRRRLASAGVKIRPAGGGEPKALRVPVQMLAERYKAGETTYELAEDAGVSPPVVNRRLREAGVRLRPSGRTSARTTAARAQRRAGSDGTG